MAIFDILQVKGHNNNTNNVPLYLLDMQITLC